MVNQYSDDIRGELSGYTAMNLPSNSNLISEETVKIDGMPVLPAPTSHSINRYHHEHE